jgi:hypothetical protein
VVKNENAFLSSNCPENPSENNLKFFIFSSSVISYVGFWWEKQKEKAQ